MSHRHATSARIIEIASRTDAGNPAFVEDLRRRIQSGLPYGAGERIKARLTGVVGNVEEQLLGRNRLSVAVLAEALAELPPAVADSILDDLARPLGRMVVARPGAGELAHPVAASGNLIAAAGLYAAALGRAMGDGTLDVEERASLRRDLAEVRRTVEQLEATLS